jgi:hypothetical protein
LAKNGAEIEEPEEHLTMYGAAANLSPHLFVETVDQFGPRTLEAVAARVLLLPTEKVAVEGKPTKLGFPNKLNHYWCYQVSCAAREGDTVAAPSCDGSHTTGERFSFNFVAVP